MPVAVHGNHVQPQLLRLLVDEVGETGVDVAGGDRVDASEIAPLVGQRLGHVDAAGLRDVVRGLLLRVVGDQAGHGCGDDEGPGATLLEVRAYGFGAVGGAVQIRLDYAVPVLRGAVDDAAVGSCAGAKRGMLASVYTHSDHGYRAHNVLCDEGIDLSKVLDDVTDELLALRPLADVALVCLHLDAVLLREGLGVLLGTLVAGRVGDGEVGAHLGAAPGGLDTDAPGTGGAGDDDNLALEAEHVLQGVGLGNVDRHCGGCVGCAWLWKKEIGTVELEE